MSSFTDFYSFLEIAPGANVATIAKALNTKSRKLDLQEEQSRDISSVKHDRKVLEEACATLTDEAKRDEWVRKWSAFKIQAGQDRVKYFTHRPRYQESDYEPHPLYLPRGDKKREPRRMQDQHFRRLAHQQSFPQYQGIARSPRQSQQPMRQSIVSFVETIAPKPTVKHSKEPLTLDSFDKPPPSDCQQAALPDKTKQGRYLEIANARDGWQQVVNDHLREYHHLQQQLTAAQQGIIPPGHEDLFKWASCPQTALAGIMRRLNNSLNQTREAGLKAHAQWESLEMELKKLET
ncbi:hypothetical protein F5884DRAFT_901330 [Xylogone sp. PMI_703]|nr:hypothetical protein F5884DRAFT_901330 [Xylogone sp. PMI_703]